EAFEKARLAPPKLSFNYHSPFTTHQSPIYKTGDLARWLTDGNVEYIGRIDHQVKIRGFRIELGEIESRLLKVSEIKEAVVVALETGRDDKYLCAYFVSGRTYEISEFRETLAKELPDYMIPSYFMQLEKIPLTPNGKIDHRALPRPELKLTESYTAPRNKIEKKLVELWAELLGRDALHVSQLQTSIGIDDNFFQLGGHSLKATILVSKIHKEFNVKVPLVEIFKLPRIRELAVYIKGKKKESYNSIEPGEEKEYYALSPAQKRLYILQQMSTDNTNYNMPHIIPLKHDINKEKLESIFKALIARHESLRTSFEIVNEKPVQKIHKEIAFSIRCEYASTAEVEHIIANFDKPFDLSKAPLLRVALLTVASTRQILLIDMHHIITDGISRSILEKEFMALYSGKELPPLRLQYKDYSEWQNNQQQRLLIKEQEKYWLEMFAEEIPVFNLPADFSRPKMQSFEGGQVRFLLTVKESLKLKELAKQTGVTLYMCILSVFTILLSRLSGQEDIVVGTPIAARRHADLEKIIGMFVNTLAMRNSPCGEKNYSEFLLELKERTLKAFENQEYQFEELVDKISLSRDTSRNPIFDVMFSLLNIEEYHDEIPGSEEKEQYLYQHIKGISKFDLALDAVDLGERCLFNIEYCSRLFKPETINRFISYFKRLLNSLSGNGGKKLSELDIITGEEKHQILSEFNDTKVEYPKNKTIHQLFEEQVEKSPDRIALVGGATVQLVQPARIQRPVSLTYHQLNEQSSHLASLLIEKGVEADTIVAILIERSVEMIIGILGILKSGGAYLPIDPEYPQERINYMLKDSGSRLLVTTNDLESEEVRSWEGEKVILEFILHHSNSLSHQHSALFNQVIQHSNHLAYIIYTSGTTGKPKGVMIDHYSVVNMVISRIKRYQVQENEHMLQSASYSFDASVEQIFTALLSGSQSVIVDREILLDLNRFDEMMIKHSITHMDTVPLFLSGVQMKPHYNLKRIAVGADICPINLAKSWICYNTIDFYNEYGPTEAAVLSVDILVKEINEDLWKNNTPIGKPIDNTAIYLLDARKNLVPLGVSGELHIGGDGIARGYLNNPELTAENFVHFHHSALIIHHFKLYRTGDLARWLPDGNIEFLGRIDNQVKIRGFRIELGEIESRLLKVDGIKEAVVVALETGRDDKYLCAYFVSDRTYKISDLRESLAKELPDYMTPSYFVQVEKIPLTPNGKIDRRALPLPEAGSMGSENIPPSNEIEEKLTQIWANILDIEKEKISTHRNFFELGGTSMSLIRQISLINKEFGYEISVNQIYQNPTILEIAKCIQSKKYVDEPIVLLNQPKQKKLFFFPPGGGFGIPYQPLANILTDYSIYSFNFIENENRLHEYVEIITTIQKTGPYILAGWSAPGELIFKVVKAMETRGFEVSDIILFDCFRHKKEIKEGNYDAKGFEDGLNEFISNIENEMDKAGIGYLKEKVRKKTKMYLEYLHHLNKFEGIHSNVHLIIAERIPGDLVMDHSCWDELTDKPVMIHNGFGRHDRMFSKGPVEKNAELLKKILDRIDSENYKY
ncbi:MAG: amino acid adenylation domain-containing protein, partial [Acidobacteria bacterium]|nr:amino acid adenylation domain-containing protein [Acidobacteriota bacterium]